MISQVSTLNVLASSQTTPTLRQDNIIAIKIRLSFTVTEAMVYTSNDRIPPCILGDQLMLTPRTPTIILDIAIKTYPCHDVQLLSYS